MAAIAAAATAFTTLHLSKTSFILPRRHLRTVITSSFSTKTTEFNITFAPPKPKPQLQKPSGPDSESADSSISDLGDQLYIPWIVRDENGNLTLQTTPPQRFLKALAHQSTQKKKKKDDKSAASKVKPTAPSVEPKYSKAARRFYNERFREPPQRLAKVLAAAGGNCLHAFHLLHQGVVQCAFLVVPVPYCNVVSCLYIVVQLAVSLIVYTHTNTGGFSELVNDLLLASRRSSEELIFQGKVTVNGSVCNTPQTKVDPGRDVIYVNGNRLAKKLPPKVYLALNKPKGYICSSGEKETKSVMSLFDDFVKSWNKKNPGLPKPRLFTVGRLDVATTGLIIVTNDGEFANKVSHPSSNLSKDYRRCPLYPDLVELLPQQPDISRPRLRIVVHEGRNHEVRELVKNAGLQVHVAASLSVTDIVATADGLVGIESIHALKRVRIGNFRLPSDLALGKHVELTTANLRALGWKS
ncbi:hypothetical protein DH2020_028356 [Rehmannia glutinosa]|uniref:RNA-binding S4 domain-containing protein n=1 Tax=Rehmannia glutinosa TaxID=99300 RepID=A0ABR0VTC7_REHGL